MKKKIKNKKQQQKKLKLKKYKKMFFFSTFIGILHELKNFKFKTFD